MRNPDEEDSGSPRRYRLRRVGARIRLSARRAVPVVALLYYSVRLVRTLLG
ncbi:hypothetical protein [Streptomyces globosus]|uniref:hypothetical protein n=1 Tax=Streptomyces globosus TaxID=68209 RepID=UPI0013B3B4D4|nr:hypothetical protein [Streptomyces globosus]